jgi:hypothetical protein
MEVVMSKLAVIFVAVSMLVFAGFKNLKAGAAEQRG